MAGVIDVGGPDRSVAGVRGWEALLFLPLPVIHRMGGVILMTVNLLAVILVTVILVTVILVTVILVTVILLTVILLAVMTIHADPPWRI